MREGKGRKQAKYLPSGNVGGSSEITLSRIFNMRGKRDMESAFDGT